MAVKLCRFCPIGNTGPVWLGRMVLYFTIEIDRLNSLGSGRFPIVIGSLRAGNISVCIGQFAGNGTLKKFYLFFSLAVISKALALTLFCKNFIFSAYLTARNCWLCSTWFAMITAICMVEIVKLFCFPFLNWGVFSSHLELRLDFSNSP